MIKGASDVPRGNIIVTDFGFDSGESASRRQRGGRRIFKKRICKSCVEDEAKVAIRFRNEKYSEGVSPRALDTPLEHPGVMETPQKLGILLGVIDKAGVAIRLPQAKFPLQGSSRR